MIDKLLNDGYYVSVLSNNDYQERINELEKQIKGKSKYDNTAIVFTYLPDNKEFYVFKDYINGYEDGYEDWDFEIIVVYKGIPFLITDCGSN